MYVSICVSWSPDDAVKNSETYLHTLLIKKKIKKLFIWGAWVLIKITSLRIGRFYTNWRYVNMVVEYYEEKESHKKIQK